MRSRGGSGRGAAAARGERRVGRRRRHDAIDVGKLRKREVRDDAERWIPHVTRESSERRSSAGRRARGIAACSVDARRFEATSSSTTPRPTPKITGPPFASPTSWTLNCANRARGVRSRPWIRTRATPRRRAPSSRALALRSGAALGTANRLWRASPFFGWNLVCPTVPRGLLPVLRVGDDVAVLETSSRVP